MQPEIIFRTQLQIDRAIARIRAIRPDNENPLAVWIGPYRKIRTLSQNALYFRLLKIIADATGNSKGALHAYFKEQCFGKVVETIGGRACEFVPSSAKAERGDFSELIEHVQAFIAEHGIEESA